jgi:large subunit ribosomal protein L25
MPAVLYGHKVKNQPLVLNYQQFKKIYRVAGSSSLIDLQVEKDQPVKAIIHEVQLEPVTDQIIHADLYQIKMDQEIKIEIPLSFINQSPAVEEEGGSLITDREEIEVECLPQDLVDKIEVDISSLKTFDDVIRIKDLAIPKEITLLDQEEEVIATVNPPRTEEELEALEEAPAESDVEEVEVETEEESQEAQEAEEETGEKKESGQAKAGQEQEKSTPPEKAGREEK